MEQADLHKLDMSSFKARNSAILETLEAQEQERNSLWEALQKAREDGERLRQEAYEKAPTTPTTTGEDIAAPTSADLMAMLENDTEEESPEKMTSS